MQLINKHKNLRLVVEEQLLFKLEEQGVKSYPKECGGFLVGYYSADYSTLHLTNFLLPEKQIRGCFYFERSVEMVEDIFYRLFKKKKQHYIGEWHTHPDAASMYSPTDQEAMVKIANCKTVHIDNPILLILSVGKEHLLDFSFYLYDKERLFKYD